ncbi:unnamed protein product, partial [marine sediment metagenome]
VEYLIVQTDVERAETITKRKVTFLTEQRLHGILDETEFISRLNELKLETVEIEMLIAEVQDKIESNISVPPRTTVVNWFKLGLIDAIALEKRLKSLGYKGEDLALFIEEATTKLTGEPTLPTKADILAWFKKKIIDMDKLKELFSDLGYPDWAIEYYAQAATS